MNRDQEKTFLEAMEALRRDICPKCGWYWQPRYHECKPLLGASFSALEARIESPSTKLGWGSHNVAFYPMGRVPTYGPDDGDSCVIVFRGTQEDPACPAMFCVDRFSLHMRLDADEVKLLVDGLAEIFAQINAKRNHCADAHCELPKGHAGVHQFAIKVRR